MTGKTLADRDELRARTLALYDQGHGCKTIAAQLGESHTATFRRLQRLGVLRDKDTAYAVRHTVEQRRSPFQNTPGSPNLRSAAIGEAIRWFLDRGYVPSVPVEATRYDLVVESDEGLQRVQIKSTSHKSPYGVWVVHAHRTQYDATAEARGTAGKRRSTSYTKEEIDWFFIVTSDNTKYLIPIEVVEGASGQLSLGKKYDSYKV